jgi:hypothetical protein
MPAGIAKLLLVAALGYQTPRLITAIPPSSPWNAVIGNTVLATVELDQKGTMTQVRVLEGVTPFVEEAERSISQWQFDPARLDGNAVATEVSVIMMFRPHSFGNFGVGGPTLGFTKPDIPQGDHPALPITVFDPELPVLSYLNPPGVVIFDLELSEDGLIHRMRLINDVPAVAERARQAVKRWNFMPAVRNGKPVRSTMLVAISFVPPVLLQ